MKKYAFFLLASLALGACEQSELETVMGEQPVDLRADTRATGSIADFDPLNEFFDIPINIINVGNPTYKYLSCEPSGSAINMNDKDDNSGRQRWYIKYGGIVVSGGHDNIDKNYFGVVTPSNHLKPNEVPTGVSLQVWGFNPTLPSLPALGKEYLDNGNIRFLGRYVDNNSSFAYKYLSTTGVDSRELTFVDENNASELSQWRAVPVGEYELVDLQYVKTTVDNFDVQTAVCDVVEHANNSSEEITWTYAMTASITESSNFSTTEGVTVTMSDGVNIGLPNVIGIGTSISYNTSFQQQTSHSYTFGESLQTTVSRVHTANVTLAPNTKVRLETTLFTYKGNLTYVATLRKIGTNETFRIKGRWTGDCFSKFVSNVYDVATDELLSTYDLEEQL